MLTLGITIDAVRSPSLQANVETAGLSHRIPLAAPTHASTPLSPHERRIRLVTHEAGRAGVPVAIALAVSFTENWGGDPLAVSKAGAVGIMQVMPNVWGDAFYGECGAAPLTDARRNACVGVRILKEYFDRYGNWNLALRAYHGSLRYRHLGDEYVAQVMSRLNLGV
jgi:soluble lytic murein transglycosylase-like protein